MARRRVRRRLLGDAALRHVSAPLAGADTILYGVADGRTRTSPRPRSGAARAGSWHSWRRPAAPRRRSARRARGRVVSAGARCASARPTSRRPPRRSRRAGGRHRARGRAPRARHGVDRDAPPAAGRALRAARRRTGDRALPRDARGLQADVARRLDGGRVAVVALRTAAGATRATVLLVTPRLAEPAVLVASAPSPAALAYRPTLSSFGHGVAFRRRVGSERGLADQIVIVNALPGTAPHRRERARARRAALRSVARLRPRRLERGRGRRHAPRTLARARDACVTDVAALVRPLRASWSRATSSAAMLLVDGVGGRSSRPRRTAATPRLALFRGPTPRNESMFGPAGRALRLPLLRHPLVLNIVCGARGRRGGVLIRALEPTAGSRHARAARPRGVLDLCRGPGRLGQALAIGPALDGEPIGAAASSSRSQRPSGPSSSGPRIGITRRSSCPGASCSRARPTSARPVAHDQLDSAPFAAGLSGNGYCE